MDVSVRVERASLTDLATPDAHRVHMPVDVFHVTDYRVVRMDCPVVASLHDALPIKYPQWCNPRLRGLKNWLQRKAAQKADHVIALSHYAIDELVECFGIDERRITVVPCGVDEEWLTPPPAAASTTSPAFVTKRYPPPSRGASAARARASGRFSTTTVRPSSWCMTSDNSPSVLIRSIAAVPPPPAAPARPAHPSL